MAKRAGARRAGAGPEPKSAVTAEDRLVDAALALAARQGWRETGLGEIAVEAGLPLDQAYAACRSRLAILAALHRRIDRAALAGASAAQDEPRRDRLFDILMRRFDALQPHRAALRAIVRDSLGDPLGLLAVPALLRSMAWMLEAAGLASAGWRGRLRVHVLAGLYLSVLRVFLDDDTADLTKTMAALDRRLRRAESLLGTGGGARAEAGPAKG
jgi:AcrR family transcriptional regulator